MATIRKEIEIERKPNRVWDAIPDVGSIHTRLVPGFVVDCRLEGDWRTVTSANGMVVRELIVSSRSADLMPNEVRDFIEGIIQRGLETMKAALEKRGH